MGSIICLLFAFVLEIIWVCKDQNQSDLEWEALAGRDDEPEPVGKRNGTRLGHS